MLQIPTNAMVLNTPQAFEVWAVVGGEYRLWAKHSHRGAAEAMVDRIRREYRLFKEES